MRFLPAFAYATFLFYLSSGVRLSPVHYSDKTLHVVAYGILGFFLAYGLQNFRLRNMIFVASLIGTLYGISDEIHQHFVPGRVYSYGDMIADAIGSFVGAVAFCFAWQLGKRLHERYCVSKQKS